MAKKPGDWKPYNVKALVRNVEQVLKNCDISRLNKTTYGFITQHMGFIAHYNLSGFQAEYEDLRDFCQKLQTGETSFDFDHNLTWADRIETDKQFREWYGQAYNQSRAEVIRGIVAVARQYQPQINAIFAQREKDADLSAARRLLAKHGHNFPE